MAVQERLNEEASVGSKVGGNRLHGGESCIDPGSDTVVGAGAELHLELPGFEGPFDLLLHLIHEHELDILNIPVAFITDKYLQYLSLMQELNIDVASEYLVMAATLAYMKSRMLLPSPARRR